MIRRMAMVIVGVMAYLVLLAELDHLDSVTTAQIEQQRYFNAHQ
jgi:hypothetical protein